jgi:ABC-type dipeptide/oligopeptide/nickel transport system permease component
MTGDRGTLYTVPEVQDIIDTERAQSFFVAGIAAVVAAVIGFAAGIWFATNLYGGR